MIDDLYTRFRAYAMPNGGISMSYLVDSSFTLIEARYNEDNISKIKSELELSGNTVIDLLHLSSWDSDCCNSEEIKALLKDLQPLEVEIPAYDPIDENGRLCRKAIREFCHESDFSELFEAGPKTLLDPSTLPDMEFTDIIFAPIQIHQTLSNCSVVKIFRQGKFSLLNASNNSNTIETINGLKKTKLQNSVDMLITRGDSSTSNPFISKIFLEDISPEMITIAGSSPQLYVRKNNSLDDRGIRASITEQGDIIVKYGIMSRKERMNLENTKNEPIGNGEYQKLKSDK